MKTDSHVERGDFQTPMQLARDVCAVLIREGVAADAIVEPTVGRGAFLAAAAEAYPKAQLRGIDINFTYVEDASRTLENLGAAERSNLQCADFFTFDWEHELQSLTGNLLILGNPPWVTNAAIAAANGTNLPAKENFLGLKGIAARTGKSNFDISEWILIRLLQASHARRTTIAVLCKSATARKFLRYAWQNHGLIAKAKLFKIDAAAHFNAAVDACLLLVTTGSDGPERADIFPSLAVTKSVQRLGLAGKDIVADMDLYDKLRAFDGLCAFQWRSGIKHDCASVMELRTNESGHYINGLGDHLSLESEFVYPFLKCSDLANNRLNAERAVIVTQRFVGDDTASIETKAPRTWQYLQVHVAKFAARKSSIYRKSVPFALFGIGEYSFAPWKVAVSGLHRSSRFRVIGPVRQKPVFFDDASYFLSFGNERDASTVAAILNSAPCQHFLSAIVFVDAKRPITAELLQRLNLESIAEAAGLLPEWRQVDRFSYSATLRPQQVEFAMEDEVEA